MTMSTRIWIGLTVLFVLMPIWGGAQTQQKQVTWYTPTEADFRAEYDRDTANQARQSWSEYFGWVRRFYTGSFGASGWTAQGQSVIRDIRSAQSQQDLVVRLNALGKKISREWSKDNGVRKIDTADLGRWGTALAAARTKDTGSGDNIRITIIDVNEQADRKLGVSRK